MPRLLQSGRSAAIRGATSAVLAAAALALAPLAVAQQQPGGAAATPPRPDLAQLLRRIDDLYQSRASISVAELNVVTPRQTRSLRMRIWTRGEDHALVVIQAPSRERGTATLRVGNNLWNYLPHIARTIRIPESMMLASWMGSDFSNDDLVKESSYRRDFQSSIVGRSTDPVGWLLRMQVRPGVVGRWKRIDMVVSDDGTVPIQARYYDRRDRLARTMSFEDVRTMDGHRIPTRLVMTPTNDTGHRTELRYTSIDFDADVPDSTFSLSRLEQAN